MRAERISLDEKQSELIDRLMRSGRFSSPSDILARGLELLDEREESARRFLADIETEIVAGLASGPATEMETAEELLAAFRRPR